MLSGLEIKRQVELGNIVISNFNEKQLNPNSYNIKLGRKLKVYEKTLTSIDQIEAEINEPFRDEYMNIMNLYKEEDKRIEETEKIVRDRMEDLERRLDEHRMNVIKNYTLDPRKDNETLEIEIPEDGYILVPGRLYLGETEEYTETYGFVPNIDGRSTTGRLGLEIHRTAGFGDNGFKGKWTLEITATHPVLIYPGMEIGQIYYEKIDGDSSMEYNGKYQNQQGVEAAKVDN